MMQSVVMKRLQVTKQIQELERILRSDDEGILQERQMIPNLDPLELLRKLKEGELSAVNVLNAFQNKALEITKKINCVTEFIYEAQEWAEACDALPVQERGPLHGLPVSVKDNVDVRGMDSTLGLAKHCFNPASSNAVVVAILIKQGAVPFCKTNVPQTLLSFCCSNPVYGITVNPWDCTRTPGGSSGGEAALISAGGSVVGIGSDLAGSARVPASFSGCVGLKPTKNRISSKGLQRGLKGAIGVASTIGILGRDVNIVATCLKAITEDLHMRELDGMVPPLPWNELALTTVKKPTFGYYDSFEFFPATPGVRRGVMMAKHALEQAGFKVQPFEIPNVFETFRSVMRFGNADAGNSLKKHLKNEKIDPSLNPSVKLASIPQNCRGLFKSMVALQSPILAESIQVDCFNSYDLWTNTSQREKFIDALIQKMRENDIDLLLSPVHPLPAPQYYVSSTIVPACIYTLLYNYCDFPSGTVPVTRESEKDQEMLHDYPEHDLFCHIVKKATRGALGLPIGVLITGIPWQEELLCRGMNDLEAALKMLEQL